LHKANFVFNYGSNMDPAQMRERCSESSLSWFVAQAEGWSLCFPRFSKRRGGGVGSLTANPKETVWGVVFSVSDRDLIRLDRFEGVPTAYKRDLLQVKDLSGRYHDVWAYFANPDKVKEHHPPTDEYIQLYIRGALYFDLPEPYLEQLRKIRTDERD
jgi:gamma-glutamylcyclotransferase (GGCT)/AIG2-like uncharacterized protein YtfP